VDVPEQWQSYPCEDYYQSPLAVHGYWSDPEQLWMISPADKVTENSEAEFLEVRNAGVDGISLGYRVNQPGFWAYYPMESEFK
jgi:hypothetical protein